MQAQSQAGNSNAHLLPDVVLDQPRGPTSSGADAVGAAAEEYCVVSGGSGFNDLVNTTPGATFVMPISDDGGSSSEIIRVLGGPSLGDLRSRLVRLIPLSSSSPSTASTRAPPSNDALHALLSYRLPSNVSSQEVKEEWLSIVEGRHALWRGVEPERREVVRGFLVSFQSEVLRRAHRNFNFRGGSIGNFTLSAMQRFFRSIQSAIFLFSAMTQMQARASGRVLPVINTNHTATIAAQLENGEIIVGQCEISHPASPSRSARSGAGLQVQSNAPTHGAGTPSSAIFNPLESQAFSASRRVGNYGDGLDPDEGEYDSDNGSVVDDDEYDQAEAERGFASVSRRRRSTYVGNIGFREAQGQEVPLPSPIERIFYVNAYRQEVFAAPNPEFIVTLNRCSTLVYSCGSLWTSIIPCLALRGVGTAIARSASLKRKILLLNSTYDRETAGLTALGFLRAITHSLNYADRPGDAIARYEVRDFVTHVVYFPEGEVPIDVPALQQLGVQCVPARQSDATRSVAGSAPRFDESSVRDALERIAAQATL